MAGYIIYSYLFLLAPGESNAVESSVVAFFLLYVQALLINYLVNEHRMTSRQTFLPAMAYLLITSLFPEWNYFQRRLCPLRSFSGVS